VVIDAERADVDVTKSLIDVIPIQLVADSSESVQSLHLHVVLDCFELVMVVMLVANEDQVGGDFLAAVGVDQMRIKNNVRALAGLQFEERLAMPTNGKLDGLVCCRVCSSQKQARSERRQEAFHGTDS